MIDYIEVRGRVLRKRKIPQDTYIEKPENTEPKQEYNVFMEHSYFRIAGKKKCRWPDTKQTSTISDEKLPLNNNGYSDNNFVSIPDYLEGYRTSSDEDDDNEFVSLASLLRAEYENDMKAMKQKTTRTSNTTLLKCYPATSKVRKKHESSKKHSGINLTLSNYDIRSSVPQDFDGSLSTVRDSTTNVKNPKQIKIISSYSCADAAPELKTMPLSDSLSNNPNEISNVENNFTATASENQNINELKTMPLSDSLNNNTITKSNVKNIFTCDDMLLNESLNEKNKNDLIEESQDKLFNSTLVCADEVMENKESSELNLRSSYKSPIVKNVSLLPENVAPPFEWYHIIYLAMKHSTYEYVTSQEIQNFSRHWFPFYCKKSWIRIICTTLNCYQKKYFVKYSFAIEYDDAWTVNKTSVNYLEVKMMSVVEQFEKAIKSSMRNPDQLPLLLKGYGVFELGFNNK